MSVLCVRGWQRVRLRSKNASPKGKAYNNASQAANVDNDDYIPKQNEDLHGGVVIVKEMASSLLSSRHVLAYKKSRWEANKAARSSLPLCANASGTAKRFYVRRNDCERN